MQNAVSGQKNEQKAKYRMNFIVSENNHAFIEQTAYLKSISLNVSHIPFFNAC
jgi:hypothetical protein